MSGELTVAYLSFPSSDLTGLSHLSPSLCFVVVCYLSFAMPPSMGMQPTDLPLSFLPSSTTVL